MTSSRGTIVRNAAAILGAAVFASGCYTYRPAQLTAIPIGEGVRVYLSQTGVDRLRQTAADALPGMTDRPVLSGRLVRRDAAQFSLQIPVGTRQAGFHQAAIDQQVTLPVSDLVQVELREVSGVRSGLAAAAATAVLAVVVVTILDGARNPSGGPGPDADNLRIPLFWASLP